MITEDYCSYKIAKLLEEKGFDEPCLSYFWSEESNKEVSYMDFPFTNKQLYNGQTLRPTLQMAMAWLREEKNIFIVIEPHAYDYINEKNSSYVYSLWVGDNYYENPSEEDFPSYKETVEAALKYCLENLFSGL